MTWAALHAEASQTSLVLSELTSSRSRSRSSTWARSSALDRPFATHAHAPRITTHPVGRLKHFATVTSPLTLFATKADLERAQQHVLEYKVS